MKRTLKQIGSLFMALCIVLTMLPMTAFAETSDKGSGGSLDTSPTIATLAKLDSEAPAQTMDSGTHLGAGGSITVLAGMDTDIPMRAMEPGAPGNELSLAGAQATTVSQSVYNINDLALPIPDDVLQIEDGDLKDGVPVFNLGDYDDFKESLANGERFPITITRPKVGEAGYPVAVRLDSYSGSNDIGFQIFSDETGEETLDLIEFPANVTSKTIYIGQEYSFGDNSRSKGTLTSYLRFYDFDRTTIVTPLIRLETTKQDIEVYKPDLPLVVHAKVASATDFVQQGASRVIEVIFKDRKNSFSYFDRGFCEVTENLTLNLKNSDQTRALKPVEAVGSILSSATFVIPADDPINNEWEVVSITGIKNAADGSVFDFTYSADDYETEIDVAASAFEYDGEPVFGPVTTDKDTYEGLESVNVSVPVLNTDEIGFEANFDSWWGQFISLSYDGGQSFIPQSSIRWNSATKSIEAIFTAPENDSDSALRIAVELYRGYGEDTLFYRALFGAFKIIEISAKTIPFVPIESIDVTGTPTTYAEENTEYPLAVSILPQDATFGGYSWESSNPARASVTGGKLVFHEEGKVTLTLRSEEIAYRTEQSLPANNDVLVKTFTCLAGAPRLSTSSISVGKSDITTAVTARFSDNFDRFEDEWETPMMTYEIRKADGTIVKSGNATREDDTTEVNLTFDDVTPKIVSLYESGAFKPAYTVTLTATAGTESTSATANVYITPPPVTMESLTEASNALVGEPAAFDYRIKNLLPGYASHYVITGGGDQEQGGLTNPSEETDPATGLITLTGSVILTPAAQSGVSEYRIISVYANNKDERPQVISKWINVVDQSTARMSVEFCDGLDGTVINPESGDESDVLYGIRESRIAELTSGSAYNSQAIYEYLNRMIHTKTLKVVVPREWGQLEASGALGPVTGNQDISLYLTDEDIGKRVRLSWKNVSTTKEFTFTEDDISGKVYAFQLVGAQSLQPVSISYINGADQAMEKSVTPYNGHVIFYEASGIKGDVWMSQQSDTGSYRFASIVSPKSLSKSYRNWAREYDQATMVVSSLATNHRYINGNSAQAFTAETVIMSEPMASFSHAGNIVPTIVRYCAIDDEGNIITGTKGETSTASGSGSFQLPFRALYENPGSRLMVELEYSVAVGTRTQLEYYDVKTLEENLRYGKENTYVITVSGYLQKLTVTGTDGQSRNLPISSKIVTNYMPGDIMEVHLATGARAIRSASLDIVNYQSVSDGNGKVSHWEPDFTATSPAVGIVETDWEGFTPNKYTTLQFRPATGQMTPGLVTQMFLNVVFQDGTSDKYSMGWGQMADQGTAGQVKKITDLLKSQKFIHEEQRVMRMGDAKIKENTRDVKVEGVKVTFDEDVAALFDEIKVDFTFPQENPSNPFIFEVTRRGNEYDIRGYVNASIMNQAGWVNLTDRWQNASYNDLFETTKQEVNTAFRDFSSMGSFPGIKGYLEGKATMTPGGDIRITFHEGRIATQAQLLYKPSDLFDLGYYCEWGIAFEGMVRTKMEIEAPDNGGNPACPLNFNLVETSDVEINVLTGSNAVSFDVGVYALDIGLHGGIEASYRQKSIYRPYAKDAQKMQRGVYFSTSGDLMARNYNRIQTDILDFPEVTERIWSIWNSRVLYYGRPLYGFCSFQVPNDTSNPLNWNYKPNISQKSALPMAGATATSFGMDSREVGQSGLDVNGLDSRGASGRGLDISGQDSTGLTVNSNASLSEELSLVTYATAGDYKPNLTLLSALPMTGTAAPFGLLASGLGVEDLDSISVSASGLNASEFGASSAASLPRELSADPFAAARYYKNGTDMVYRDSSGKIKTSGIDGAGIVEIAGSGFGLDIASDKSGSTVAVWGSYRDGLQSTLDSLSEGEKLRYAAGMTEIKAGTYNGTNWDIQTLTNNEMMDINPKAATNGSNSVVVWTQGKLDDSLINNDPPIIGISETRLMFAQHKGTTWSEPAQLYLPSDGKISEYTIAMADDGSALVTVAMDNGKIVIIRISSDAAVTVINNSLPAASKTSLNYNGKTYTLACCNTSSMAFALYELSANGFVMNTTFTDVPTGIGEDFRLFRDWSATGMKASVLVWPGFSEDENSEARIFASRMLAAESENTMLVTPPITAAAIEMPSTTGDDAEAGVHVFSYDAYIQGNDLKLLTVFGASKTGESGGNVYLEEAQVQYKNTVEADSGMNDISGLMPEIKTNFDIKVKNTGFMPITSIDVRIGSGESSVNTVRVLPNEETVVTAPFIPTRDLPDSVGYTATAVFGDGSEAIATGSISLLQADIAAEMILLTQENDAYVIEALISNNTPFSLSSRTVIAGIYQDPFGKVPVTEERVDGSNLESGTLGTSVLVDLAFANAQHLPQLLYLIAKAYDSSNNEIPDKDSMNNILTITNSVVESSSDTGDDDESSTDPGDDGGSSSNPGDNDGGSSSSGDSSSGSTSTNTTTSARAPGQSVIGMTSVTASAGANGAASTTIPDKAITDAIAMAKAQDETANSIAVGLNVTMPAGATSLTATLTRSSLNSLVGTGVSQLELSGSPVSLGLDLKALQEIQKRSSGDISITIAPATELSNETKALIGNRPVYNIAISSIKDDKTVNVTSLGNGTATLSIPYTPGSNEAIGYLFGVYVDANGKALRIPDSTYDANSGSLLMPTNHFSVYGVGYTAPSARFTDIGTHWGKEAIDYVVGRGLLKGISETAFDPNTAMTRGMLVTVLGRLAGADVTAYTTSSFTDVASDKYYTPYIEWAYKQNVVKGIGNQRFDPDRAITREEIAMIFANYAKATGYTLPVTGNTTGYEDTSSIGSIYKTAVTAIQQAGIMIGGTDNRFNPKSNATRAEVSTMLYRYVRLTIEPATAQGWVLNDAGQWLCYKDSKALTGTRIIDGVKYFFETNGVLRTGWVKDGDNWRCYSGNKMLVGFTDCSSTQKTYYFEQDGLMVSDKWLQIDGRWYYFHVDGALARSTIIDGYEIDEDGVRKQ